MDALIFAAGQQASQASVDLHRLGTRCLREPASRRLDGEIYCAIHKVTDWNPLWNDRMFWARENGEVLVEHCPGDGLCGIVAPPFTTELRYAESLLPEGLCTFYRDARKVCATALHARALANEPPLTVSRSSSGEEAKPSWLGC
jgi:hypothetical protein